MHWPACLLTAAALAPAARADFVIAGLPPPQTPTTPPPAAAATLPATLRFWTAYGFGDQVPLSFAVKQIVPKAVKVSYGPGADPASLVDWRGGRPWNRVLLAAVKPLGLRLVTTYMAVEIRK